MSRDSAFQYGVTPARAQLPGMSTVLSVLLVEDDRADALLIETALQRSTETDCSIRSVGRLSEAATAVGTEAFDIILLDLNLPDCRGLRTLDRLREVAPDSPIIVLSGLDSLETAVQSIERGAQDYIVKGNLDGPGLMRAIRYARERHHLESELVESRERYRTFAEAASDWLWETDSEHRFTYISPAFETATGLDPRQFLGHRRLDIFDHADWTPEMAQHRDALDRREPFKNFEYVIETESSDPRTFRVSGVPLFAGPHFRGYRGVGTEVTHFKAMGQALRDKVAELQYSRDQMRDTAEYLAGMAEEANAQKERAEMEARAKADFLSTMSHEIRTPMTGVLGLVELLLREPLTPRQADIVRTIQDSSETLVGVLNDILDISKLEAGELSVLPTPTRLDEVMTSTRALFMKRAEDRGNTLHVDCARDLPDAVLVDGQRLRQILFNLVGNAVKFTENGTITMSVAPDDGPSAKPPDSDGLTLRFAVEDTGIGIPADRLGRLFQRFKQADEETDRTFGGTGLGLALCRSLVNRMGGHIWAESEHGVGSRFTFTLPVRTACLDRAPTEPVSSPATRADPTDATPASDDTPTPARILVAEDNKANQMILAELLGCLGKVTLASNGRDAVEAFEKDDFDIILTDIHMPEMDGFEVMRRIRSHARGADVPLVTLSGDVMPEQVARQKAAGADACLGKPFDLGEMIGTIQSLLEHAARSRPGKEETHVF